jgi:hypothetical protein
MKRHFLLAGKAQLRKFYFQKICKSEICRGTVAYLFFSFSLDFFLFQSNYCGTKSRQATGNTVRSPGRGREKEPANGRESNGRADHGARRVDDRTVVVLHQRDEVRLLAPGLAIKNAPKKPTQKTHP